ncbi:MAG: hypothetical protein ACYTGG_08440 [Planctomycetota bacterium]|jgi:hypothetical protein
MRMRSIDLRAAALGAAIFFAATAHGQTTIHVDDDACPGPGSGTEMDPYCSIQIAINAASDGDEILVAPGTYYEAIDLLGKAVWLHSAGGADVTTIDATGLNAAVVTCANNEGSNTVLEGFRITGGSGTWRDDWFGFCGGGLYILESSPTIQGCVIAENVVSDGAGGGMYNDGASPTVTGCIFDANRAQATAGYAQVAGGGIYNSGGGLTIVECGFVGNRAIPFHGGQDMQSWGGAVHHAAGDLTITGSEFLGNEAQDGGGVYDVSGSSITILSCLFSANIATGTISDDGDVFGGHGGGLRTAGGSPVVMACDFIGNSAAGTGGGMHSSGSSPTVTGCTFTDNSANNGGGGMHNDGSHATITGCQFVGNTGKSGGGVANSWGSSPTLINCTFEANVADWGGGMSSNGSSPTVTDCVFAGNIGIGGGGMFSAVSSQTVAGCTFIANEAAYGRAIACNSFPPAGSNVTVVNCILWDGGDEVVSVDDSTIIVTFSDVQGGFAGTGNIDADPMFVDAANGDYRLQTGSPCADAGHNNGVPADTLDLDDDGDVTECIPFDLDGQPRFQADEIDYDPGCGIGAVVDMGAFEHPGSPIHPVIVGDLDGSGDVTITDLLALLATWGPAAVCEMADANIDGVVDIIDLLELLAHWG